MATGKKNATVTCRVFKELIGVCSAQGSLQGAFESGRWLETDGLGCRDFDCLASLRVATGPCGTAANLKSAEAEELDATIFFDAFRDVFEHGFHCFLCSFFGGFSTEC